MSVPGKGADEFERRLVAYITSKLGVTPKAAGGTNASYWTFSYQGKGVEFVVVGPEKNSAQPPRGDVTWLLRIREPAPPTFFPTLAPFFTPDSALERAIAGGKIQIQWKSTDLLSGTPLSQA